MTIAQGERDCINRITFLWFLRTERILEKNFVLLPFGYPKALELTFENFRTAEFRTVCVCVCVRLSVCESL